MDTPNWVSFFENSQSCSERRRVFHISECAPASTKIYQPDVALQDSANSRRISHESLCRRPLPAIPGEARKTSMLNRPLPPTPVPNQDRSIEIRQKLPNGKNQTERSQHGGLHTRRKKRRTQSSCSNKIPKDEMAVTKTSVTLTVSIRNGNEAQKLRQEYINNNYTDISSLKRPVTVQRSFSRTESEKSRTELVNTVPSSKGRRNACIVPMVIMTVVILTGLLTAVSVVLLRPLDEEESSTKEDGYDMVVGHVRMRVLNRQFHKDMLRNNSEEFSSIEIPLCTEMDGMFLFSNYTSNYYGCDVTMLRYGSVKVLQELLFKDSKELRNPASIKSIITSSSGVFDWHGLKAINIGDFVVDYSSINVNTDTKTIPLLPRKPYLQKKDILLVRTTSHPPTTTVEPASVMTDLTTSSPTTMSPSTTRKFIAKPTDATIYTVLDNKTHKSTTTTEAETTQAVTNSLGGTEDPVLINTVISASTTATTITTTTNTTTTTTTTEATMHDTTTEPRQRKFDTEGTFDEDIHSTPATPTSTRGPYVRLTNSGSPHSSTSVAVQCSLHDLQDWTHITVRHYRPGKSPRVVLNITRGGSADFPADRYANRLIVDLKLRKISASVSLNFTRIDCRDEGTYLCTAFSPRKLVTGKGYLHVKARPLQPVLTLPVEIIENREISTPVTCSGNSGYPPGRLQWYIKPRGQTRFIPIDVNEVEFTGECKNIVTGKLQYTPSIEGNGTTLKCQIVNDHVPLAAEYSTSKIVNVIPAGFCDNVEDGSVLRHPYECKKYITCINNTFYVQKCENDVCFNPETRTCGQTGLSMTNAVAYMNEGVTSLSCRLLHLGSWKFMTMWKILPNGQRVKLLVTDDQKNTTYLDNNIKGRMFVEIQMTNFEVSLKLWIYKLVCEDEGLYACSAETQFPVQDAYGRINLKVKPSSPEIKTPTEVIAGRQMREKYTCTGSVGYPHGRVIWQVKFKGQKKFINTKFNETVSIETDKCSRIVTKELQFLPSLKHEGMELKCIVENNQTLSEGQVLWDSVLVHVIAANFCSPSFTGPIPHPHDCRQYVQCSEGYIYVQKCSQGLCFNPDTLECDLPEPTPEIVFDPVFPCRPNKNGVYFPHAYLCNKYVWCVQGQEKIQHCPLGTLYHSNGQCTFNTEQSRCYRTTTTTPS